MFHEIKLSREVGASRFQPGRRPNLLFLWRFNAFNNHFYFLASIFFARFAVLASRLGFHPVVNSMIQTGGFVLPMPNSTEAQPAPNAFGASAIAAR